MVSGIRRSGFLVVAVLSVGGLGACGGEADEGQASVVVEEAPLLAGHGHARSPRLLSPLSTSVSTSRRPLFRWAPGSGHDHDGDRATVQICRDRACEHPIVSFRAGNGFTVAPRALPPGVVFWRVTERAGRHSYSSAVWELTIPVRDSGRPGSWGAVPDFNGDGFGDVAVGVKASPGEMRIFPGGVGGPSATPAQILTGGTGFGDESGPAGDVDGDGFGDLAVWTSGPPAAVTVYLGGPDGLHDPVTFAGPEADPFSQMRVLSAGDVNRDGYGDLLVGGQAFAALFLGGPDGIRTTPAQQLPGPAVPAGSPPSDARWPIGGGDFTGDRLVDAAVSGIDGARLYEGNGHRLVPRPDPTIAPGFGALAGDFNGDGIADLALGGAVLIGGPSGPTSFQAIAGEYFYQGVGDVNGDGRSDVLSMVSSLVGVLEAERIYFGSAIACTSTDCPSFVPLLIPGHLNDGNGLTAVLAGGLGDVDGDGFGDFAYVSPGQGALYLYFGSPSGPPSSPSQTITAAPGFGFSLARL